MQDLSRALFPPGATRHDWVIDGVLAGALMLFTVVPVALTQGLYAGRPLSVLGSVLGSTLMAMAMVARRHSPLLAMAVVFTGGVAMLIGNTEPQPSLIAVPIVSYAVARYVPGKVARLVLYLGALGAIAGPLEWVYGRWDSAGVSGTTTYLVILSFLCFGAVITPYAVGRRLHDSEIASAQTRLAVWERQQFEIAEREQRIRSAEINARNQIARELHDIVAHSLSVIIVQAEGGRALARKHPEAAADSLDVIAETGREALQEMRRIVGVLRSGPEAEAPAFAPAPGIADLGDLVRRTTDRATLSILGPVPQLPPALGLTVYRIVQEALTNFLKHAGPHAEAHVTVAFTPGRVDLDVSDNGLGASAESDGQGHGLRGMAERVQAMGGRLLAEPHPEGGFRVRATLPYQVRPAPVRQNVPHTPTSEVPGERSHQGLPR
jgi:signal transduction histidine kinase